MSIYNIKTWEDVAIYLDEKRLGFASDVFEQMTDEGIIETVEISSNYFKLEDGEILELSHNEVDTEVTEYFMKYHTIEQVINCIDHVLYKM